MKRLPLHEDLWRKEPPKPLTDRAFGLFFALLLLILGLLPMVRDGSPRPWALLLATILVSLAAAVPFALGPLNRAWRRFGVVASRVVDFVTMSAIFYGIVMPCALIMRVARRDVLHRQFDRARPTYWIMRDTSGTDARRMRDQF